MTRRARLVRRVIELRSCARVIRPVGAAVKKTGHEYDRGDSHAIVERVSAVGDAQLTLVPPGHAVIPRDAGDLSLGMTREAGARIHG